MSTWTLRTRLVAALVALLAAVNLVIGAVSVVALDRYLTTQLHLQLAAAARRSQSEFGSPHGHGDGPIPLQAPGQGEGTLGASITSAGVPDAGVIDSDGKKVALSGQALDVLAKLPADGVSREVDLGGSLGSYLVVASRAGGNGVAVTGLPMSGLQRTVARLALAIALVSALGLVLAAFAATAIVRLSLKPLRRMASTASRVAELPLDRGDVALGVRVPEVDTDPRTEVGQVGAALNRMLGHVAGALQLRTASEARMRRFVADASHELRTPLASIRGYAEFTRHRADELPPEVSHALRRVESEAVRMTRLVEDLLLLARLDEGSPAAAMRHEEVDLSALAVDCLADAHVLGPEHRWLLELPADPVTVIGDGVRLSQVLGNLLANARVHTPLGTTVSVQLARDVSSGSEAAGVVLQVTDDGPGIPADLLPGVFDRFTRADSSRSRAVGSTGLGLAIVASVVQAHGGRVEVTSRPGRTTFTVHLRAEPAVGTSSRELTGSSAG